MLRAALFQELQANQLRSAKGLDYTASIVERPSIIINHEQDVIEWLKATPDIEYDLYVGLKTTAFQTLAKAVIGSGQEIPGTLVVVNESLSIRSNIKKEKK